MEGFDSEVGGPQDCDHSGALLSFARVDPGDPGMSHRGSNESYVAHAGKTQVGYVCTPTAQQVRVLDAADFVTEYGSRHQCKLPESSAIPAELTQPNPCMRILVRRGLVGSAWTSLP